MVFAHDLVEEALAFSCNKYSLYGILHHTKGCPRRGLLIIVGGPQYRIGSHRQFVSLARFLAASGIPVMRFDYRGMGDSEGDFLGFESIQDDLRSAVDSFFGKIPSMKEVVTWGLCDAASASLFYAYTDSRIAGLILVNPWMRTEGGMAKAYLSHYYPERLLSGSLWGKIFRGDFRWRQSLVSFAETIGGALRPIKIHQRLGGEGGQRPLAETNSLPHRLLEAWTKFEGRVLLILSGNDLTADEFRDLVRTSRAWRSLVSSKQVTLCELKEADHTFSKSQWKLWVERRTLEWVSSW